MGTTPPRCATIAQQLEAAKDLANDLHDEWQQATGRDKTRAFDLWRQAKQEVARLTTALDRCLHPAPPRPDLVPVTVQPFVHSPADGRFDLAAVLENGGAGQAKGPFTVTLGVEYVSYSQDPPLRVYREAMINVPAGVTIEPGTTFTTDTMKDIPINRRPGSAMPPLFDVYVLADSNAQVPETVENNNYFQIIGQPIPGVR